MLLIKNRIPIVATVLVLLMGFVIVLAQASADNADGPIPWALDTIDVNWDWSGTGQSGSIEILLDATLEGDVFSIEVFVEPDTSTEAVLQNRHKPVHVQKMGDFGPFPTGRVLSFNFPSPRVQLQAGTEVGIHLHEQDGTRISADNTAYPFPDPTATPVPPPRPTPTPVPTIETDPADVTQVTAPTGGNAAIIQPSASASVSAPDGSVVVAVPATANATTFQLVYKPSPASVPAAPAGTSIIRAFELNTHNTAGTQVSLKLLKPVTITVKYTAADVEAAPQKNPANLKIVRYDSATQAWTPLNTTVDLAAKTLTAKASRFSVFAVAGIEPAPQFVGTPTPEAPPTGDFVPGSGLVLGLIIAGFLLITAGGAYLTQARRLRH